MKCCRFGLFAGIFACVVLAGCGGKGDRSYDSAEAMAADFDKVYRAEPKGLAFDVDDIVIAIKGGKESVFVKPKGEAKYALLTPDLQRAQLTKVFEKSGLIRITKSELSQSFDGEVVLIRWSYAHEGTATAEVKGGQTNMLPIGIKLCKVVK